MTVGDVIERSGVVAGAHSAPVGRRSRQPGAVGARRRTWRRELAWFVVPLALCPVVAVLRPGDADVAMDRAERLLSWQGALGVAVEPSVHAWFSARPMLAGTLMVFYLAAHLSAVIATACWLGAHLPAAYLRFRRIFAVAQVLTVAVYLALPVAPLRMVLSGDASAAGASWTRSIQYEFAAMPSGHVVFALAVGVAVWRHAPRRWRWVGVAHPACTLVAVVGTAHHLLADAAGAAVVVAASMLLVHLAESARRPIGAVGPLLAGPGSGAP